MELEYALLGMISLSGEATGFEMNKTIEESTSPLLTSSLSQIYAAPKCLHKKNLVSNTVETLKNRPNKKIYQITASEEESLLNWLKEPVESGLDFKAFFLRMAFSPLMPKDVILAHIDREIIYRESLLDESRWNLRLKAEYLDTEKFNPDRVELLWMPMNQINLRTEQIRIQWLKEWREQVEAELSTS